MGKPKDLIVKWLDEAEAEMNKRPVDLGGGETEYMILLEVGRRHGVEPLDDVCDLPEDVKEKIADVFDVDPDTLNDEEGCREFMDLVIRWDPDANRGWLGLWRLGDTIVVVAAEYNDEKVELEYGVLT
ncbi:hypothetical protein [Desulfurococcus mucosus]|uniref:Uncharacterized protein n=1 Tax=Desulfurococcus mucosus (strain ATCC 35584 / DSM 2162 / JCM 9187 / O7/1) TaxID=765177 RepID=E8R7U6_DESM0|nr:hypothetical protein [Desulfurococcus mucosus]ADV64572.1 hypothetical protein Desmu_0253 [Desulfurococcus mucosus DSM 2162]